MLQLRPSCENCQKPLAANAIDAMICSYECTFCRDCVETILHNVCPNCGGGFCRRPIRPATAWRDGVSVVDQPATREQTHQPVDNKAHQLFAAAIKAIPPENR